MSHDTAGEVIGGTSGYQGRTASYLIPYHKYPGFPFFPFPSQAHRKVLVHGMTQNLLIWGPEDLDLLSSQVTLDRSSSLSLLFCEHIQNHESHISHKGFEA